MAKKKVEVDYATMSLSELKSIAVDFAQKSNDAFENAKFQESLDATNELAKIVKQYAETKKEEVFLALKEQKDTMLEAIKQLRYEVITVKEVTVEGKLYKAKTIETKEVAIDLVALDKYCGGTIGANPEWNTAVKFLAACLVERHASDCKAEVPEIRNSKAFNNVSAEIKAKVLAGRTIARACSDKGLAETLNQIIELMIGKEYAQATEYFGQFLLKATVKKGREVLTLNSVSNKIVTTILAEIMHGIITGKTITMSHKIK